MTKLAFAIAFLSVFGIVAYAIVVRILQNYQNNQNTKVNKVKNKVKPNK